jgi:hypothetical protein
MHDGAIAFALIALAVTGWGYAFALAMELKRARRDSDGWKQTAHQMARNTENWLQTAMELEDKLAQARKNDHRDAQGRFARL